jgi:hypothetical protein
MTSACSYRSVKARKGWKDSGCLQMTLMGQALNLSYLAHSQYRIPFWQLIKRCDLAQTERVWKYLRFLIVIKLHAALNFLVDKLMKMYVTGVISSYHWLDILRSYEVCVEIRTCL